MQCAVVWQALPEVSAMYAARLRTAARGPANSNRDVPDVDDQRGRARELKLRTRPLREQWEARGPGLLLALSRRLSWLVLPRAVTVALVHPVRGGGGLIVSDATIWFEAVLANPLPHLPEVVRLGWFVAQLAARQVLGNMRGVCPDRVSLENLLAAALIPPVLAAGEQVELSSADTVMIQAALRAWHLTSQPTAAPSAEQLDQWWRQDGSNDTQDARTWWQAVDDSLRIA